MQHLLVLEARRPKRRYWLEQFLLRNMRGGSVPGLSSWLVDDRLHVQWHLSLCVRLSPNLPKSHIWLGSTLITSFWLVKDLISKYNHILRYWGLDVGRHSSIHNTLPSDLKICVLHSCKIQSQEPQKSFQHQLLGLKSHLKYHLNQVWLRLGV